MRFLQYTLGVTLSDRMRTERYTETRIRIRIRIPESALRFNRDLGVNTTIKNTN